MIGTLYLVATPIGNLKDITYRAVETLKKVHVIYCEDTRLSRSLMQAYGIDTRLKTYHEHNAEKVRPEIVRTLQQGYDVALISDAGTPLISDPGYKLVQEVQHVDVLPGASAVMASLLLSKMPTDKFVFLGFLPDKKEKIKRLLAEVKPLPMTLIFFVAPHDVVKTLKVLHEQLGHRKACLTRELTKKFQEAIHGDFLELIAGFSEKPPLGECVLCVEGVGEQIVQPIETYKAALVKQIAELGVKRASVEIAKISGHSKADVYAYALNITKNT